QPKSLIVGLTYWVMKDRRAAAPCEEARALLEKRIATTPRDPRLRLSMGQALACLGRKDEALKEARLGADLSPVSADALDGPRYLEGIAYVQVMNGDLAGATESLTRLLELPGGTAPSTVGLHPMWPPLLDYPPFQQVIAKYP